MFKTDIDTEFRSFIDIEKEKKLILPISFLIDTGCPFNMIIS